MAPFGALRIGSSALRATQTGIQITGQSTANGGEKSPRRRDSLVASRTTDREGLRIGNGVDVQHVERIFDSRLEDMLRGARSHLGRLSRKSEALSRLELVFADTERTGHRHATSRFFDAALNLANQPEDLVSRRLFLEAARDLSCSFRDQDRALCNLRRDLDFSVENIGRTMNQIGPQIADLNQRIVFGENAGSKAHGDSDPRVRRDALVGQLADLAGVSVQESVDGSFNVFIGSDFIVEGERAHGVVVDKSAGGDVPTTNLCFQADNRPVRPPGGALRGLIDARDEIVARYRDDLNTLAGAVILEVNRIHRSGEGLLGRTRAISEYPVVDASATTGLSTFFTGIDAADMEVSQEIANEIRLIATGRGGRPDAGHNMRAIAGLRDVEIPQTNRSTFEQFYGGITGNLRVETAEARELLENQGLVTERIQNERRAISGTDEDTVQLVGFQRLYQDSARYLSVVDTLSQTLMQI